MSAVEETFPRHESPETFWSPARQNTRLTFVRFLPGRAKQANQKRTGGSERTLGGQLMKPRRPLSWCQGRSTASALPSLHPCVTSPCFNVPKIVVCWLSSWLSPTKQYNSRLQNHVYDLIQQHTLSNDASLWPNGRIKLLCPCVLASHGWHRVGDRPGWEVNY